MKRLIVGLVLVAAATVPSSATALVTFGAPLTLTPDLSFRCPFPPPFFGPYARPGTCTALTSTVFGGGGALDTDLVPDGYGVITALRLLEPNVQSSALKLTVLRALRTPQSTDIVCCTVTSETQPFIPLPGQVTQIVFNPPIPVHSITTVTGVYEFEGLALTATDQNSVIPAATAPGHASGAFYPAALPGQERYDGAASLGTDTQILFQADWMPVDTSNNTGGSGGVGGGGGVPVGGLPGGGAGNPVVQQPLGFMPAGAQFTRNAATIPLVCELSTSCNGTLRLQNRAAPAGRRAVVATSKAKLYGSTRFSIGPDQIGNVKVKLNKAGKRLVRKRRAVTLYANALIGGKVESVKVRLQKAH